MAISNHTKNYDLFKFKNNRQIYLNHVNSIASNKDFASSFEFHPAVVNQDFMVIDGQHRILAAKKLNIPVWYVIQKDADEKDIMNCNINQKSWSYHDYVEFFSKKNDVTFASYSLIKELTESYGLPLHNVIRICQAFSGNYRGPEFGKNFKSGLLKLKNIDKIKEFTLLYHNLIKKMTLEKGVVSVKYLHHKCYCNAFTVLFKTNPVKLDTVLRKLPEYWKKMISVDTQEQALEVLESIRFSRVKP